MQILEANNKNILDAAAEINNGGLCAFPTETVYGLGANGLDAEAVAKIFEAKERPTFNPLILHIADIDTLNQIAKIENDKVYELIEKFWPGPLTLVLPRKEIVPGIVTAGNPTVAVRMPNHPVALELIKNTGVPIAAPSANKFGMLSPTEAKHVAKQLGKVEGLILDGGKCTVGIESTIIHVEQKGFKLLRHGGLSINELEIITGKLEKKTEISERPIAPGMLAYHYSPKIPVIFFDGHPTNMKILPDESGALYFRNDPSEYNFKSVKILSETGNFYEAAANLFSKLHQFEEEEVNRIYVERLPETGLGVAIMDRLTKASKKFGSTK